MLVLRNSNQVPSLFDRFFDGDLFDWSNRNFSRTNTTLPSVNIKETADAYEVEVAAPGFDKSDFKLELNHEMLTILSEKKIFVFHRSTERLIVLILRKPAHFVLLYG